MTRRLVFLHGFTQTSRSWDDIRSRLSNFDTVSIDAPGHGDNPNGRVSLWECADQIAESGGPGTYVGYSMGARMALHVALAHPLTVQRLVLVSGTAGLRTEEERRQRRDSDDLLARRVEEIGTERFLEEWLAMPMFRGLSRAAANIQDRLRNEASGLADSLRFCGTGTQESLWDRLGELSIPVLVVCGENDEKFVRLGEEMSRLIPDSTFVVIPDAGHTAHLEQPDRFVAEFSGWLGSTDVTLR